MVYTYPYNMVDGHIIVTSDDGKICLIDTGSPVSVGSGEDVLFAGRRHPLQTDCLGQSIDKLTEHVRTRIDVLIGVDILNQYDNSIDHERQVLEFSDEEDDVEGEAIPVELLSGIPVLEADVGGRRIKVFFDTGAPVSYARKEIVQAFPRVGTADDSHITCGAFQTDLHRVPVRLGSRTFTLDIGILPHAQEKALLAVGVEGILGTALLEHFTISYQPRRKRIIVH